MFRQRPLILLLLPLAWACSGSKSESGHGSDAIRAANDSGSSASGWSAPRIRRFELTYESTVSEVPAGTRELRVWVPIPRTQPGVQDIIKSTLDPISGAVITTRSDRTGANDYWFLSLDNPPAQVSIRATHVIHRREQVNNNFRGAGAKGLTPDQRRQFAEYLEADALVPTSGRVVQLASAVAPQEKNTVNIARSIYDDVLGKMEYKKAGTGWGRGDTLWACDNGYGNCTDFHSVFMSYARTRGIPARFHMGIPVPPERGSGTIGGYHCWAEFYVAEIGWVPVDISEADKNPDLAQYYFGALTEDRVGFTIGRDLVLDPAPASGPQNFFIYPIIEADGNALPEKHAFSYRDL